MMRKPPTTLASLVVTLSLVGAGSGLAEAGRGAAKSTATRAAGTVAPVPAEAPAATADGATIGAARAKHTAPAPAPKPAPRPTQAAERPARSPFDGLLDQLLMLQLGNAGNTQANMFIEDAARYSSGRETAQSRLYGIRGQARTFKGPSGDGSIIVMFADRSGAYIHPDGFVTPMGKDISHEITAWEELK